MSDAPRRLADVITRMRNELGDSLFAQGVVVSFTTASVTVRMMGADNAWPYLRSYTPKVGEVVLLAGSPGSWFVLGGLSHT